MPNLFHCLNGHDLGFLNIVAELWGIELSAPDAKTTLPLLSSAMQDPELFNEVVTTQAKGAHAALEALMNEGGRMPWSLFIRRFGELREMGPGRRDREKPYRKPTSACEILWYRALIGRDFLDHADELQECAYIPNEFIEWLPSAAPASPQPPGKPASRGEIAHIIPVTDNILDQACTLLAALRLEQPDILPDTSTWHPPTEDLLALLKALHVINPNGLPNADQARPFLEADRAKALSILVSGWLSSTIYNELRLMPSIICEGEWTNNPNQARQVILNTLSEIPEGQWWSIKSFIKAMHARQPDFQRPAGDYDTWLIRDALTGDSLRGVSNWFAVEGAFIRHLITGPMHWLGLLDLASPQPSTAPTAFRTSAWSTALLMENSPQGIHPEDDPIVISSSGLLYMTTLTPRIARYQVSRFCSWESESEHTYRYRLTPYSLKSAREQGLKVSHLIALLHRYGKTAPPPSLIKALKRWESAGAEAHFENLCVLRVASTEILTELRQSPVARFLGAPLGPVSIIVHEDAVEKVLATLAQMGYLADRLQFED
ncbi:MAG: helicase-associated domain-containing protein [Chloroflexota bacterium]